MKSSAKHQLLLSIMRRRTTDSDKRTLWCRVRAFIIVTNKNPLVAYQNHVKHTYKREMEIEVIPPIVYAEPAMERSMCIN